MAKKNSSSKQQLRLKIVETLSTTFEGLQDSLPKKKFERNIKKASKVIMNGLKVKATKPARVEKKVKAVKSQKKAATAPVKEENPPA